MKSLKKNQFTKLVKAKKDSNKKQGLNLIGKKKLMKNEIVKK